ncbi:ABC transporter ATP-binding protein [Bacillus cereus]|uniref:ABC transporter ATP-binding protein n=1 Tax=Bacillus cereus TaxID=1396 RepID=UPI002452D7B1|nr:ABC transporter ATP-binding protein [Bacillus cereus]MDH4423995.1 ABC transporter ATP-binding protein [Bacillus cereus]
MSKVDKESLETLSILNVWRSFRFWPQVFGLLWGTQKFYLLIILITTGLQGITPAIILICTQNIVNSVIKAQATNSFDDVIFYFLLLISIGFMNEVISLIKNYFHKLFESLLSNRVNILIMEKTINLSLTEFENADVQDQLKRSQSEANYRPYQIFMEILSIISGVIMLFSTASILLSWRWTTTILLIVVPITSFISLLRIGKQEYQLQYNRAPKYRQSWYLTFLVTKDSSFKEIKIYKLGQYLLTRYRELFNLFYQENKSLVRRRTNISFFFKLLNQVVVAYVIFLILHDTYTKQINIGQLVGMIQAVMMTQANAQGAVQYILSFCQNNLYMQQLFTFLSLDSSDKLARSLQSKEIIENNSLDSIEQIRLRNLSFCYPNSKKLALDTIDLELNRGETVAIVGKNGSGKSTLVKLMAQLYQDYQGDILINGKSIVSYPEDQFLQKIGVVFQDFVHYEMSVRENIGFGNLMNVNNSDEVLKAAERAGIKDLVNQLPSKLDTQLGKLFKDGHQLSGGQWQRVAVARAFMRNADVYILDEPSSFLDPEAEIEVFDKFRKLVENKIGIFISHRFSSVSFADKIIVMDNGRIVESGTHHELMKLDGQYAKLYRLQMSNFAKEENLVSNH